jgi:hypothetical protein
MLRAAICRWMAAAVVCLHVAIGQFFVWQAVGQEPKASPARQKAIATKEQIAAWVRELDADEFLTRENAMTELVAAGPPALVALKPVLATGSLEATSRALFIVRQLGLSVDDQTQEQADRLLTELAEREETPQLARRAAAALAELHQERAAVARTQLVELGAKVSRLQVLGGLFLDEGVPGVEIGDDFRGAERDLKRLRWLNDVPVIMLTGKRVTDGWLKHAAAVPRLEELHIYQATITDAGLAPLAEHATLKQLGLYYTPVGDEALKPLCNLTRLKFVKLYGTRVAPEAALEFERTSGVKIDLRRGAFLGVSGKPVDGICLISEVQKRSPAEMAGLLADDEVVRFGEAVITGFEQLTAAISKRDVGEQVEIEVKRRLVDDQGNLTPRNVVAKVVLMPWELEPAVRNVRQ